MALYFQILSSTTKFFGHCPENIWAAIKFFQSLDQWPILIEQFKISGRPPKKVGQTEKKMGCYFQWPQSATQNL
jgi:hypothetical protein